MMDTCPHCHKPLYGLTDSESLVSDKIALLATEGDQFIGRIRIWKRNDLKTGAFRFGLYNSSRYQAFNTSEELQSELKSVIEVAS